MLVICLNLYISSNPHLPPIPVTSYSSSMFLIMGLFGTRYAYLS